MVYTIFEQFFSIILLLLWLGIGLAFDYTVLCFICSLFGFPLWRKTKNVLYKWREKIVKHNKFDM